MLPTDLNIEGSLIRKNDLSTCYRKAHKINHLFKSMPTDENIENIKKFPKEMPIFGKPYSCTEKMDGTQIHIVLRREVDKFSLLSHSGNSIINEKESITLDELIDGCQKTGKPYTFQGGNVSHNFSIEIPKLRQIIEDYQIDEAHFYYELLFGVGKTTPKKIKYPDEVMDKCYLFNMVFLRTDEVVKISVTPNSKPFFDSYNINCVPLISELSGESLTLESFVSILEYSTQHPHMEGIILYQEQSLIKLLTLYNNETFNISKFSNKFSEYIKLQEICYQYMQKKPKEINKIDMKIIQNVLNFIIKDADAIEEEVVKEITHDGWFEFKENYFLQSQKQVDNFVRSSKLFNQVISSLTEHNESNLTKSQKYLVLKTIKNYMDKQKLNTF